MLDFWVLGTGYWVLGIGYWVLVRILVTEVHLFTCTTVKEAVSKVCFLRSTPIPIAIGKLSGGGEFMDLAVMVDVSEFMWLRA